MKNTLILIAGLIALPAQADNIGLPASTPASYKTECGSCHTPFPPGLLNAKDWQKTMTGLGKHFGTDASLDDKTTNQISAWLQRNAGRRIGASGGTEPRITATRWFNHEHNEVPARIWQDPKVKSRANCAACHKGADQGRYGERELAIPGFNRRHDDD